MRRITHLATASAVTLALGLVSGCGGTVSDAYVIEDDPGHVEEVAGSDIPHVTVTEGAAERLRIDTTPVESAGGNLMSVPNTAVFVDPHGDWWVYTTPEPLVFARAAIEIADEDDTHVFYTSGPGAGTEVVTVGVAELSGIEEGTPH